jgi:predicted Ser/Thr protein kinase
MTLRPEDWPRLKEVFERTRALAADRRPAYLAEACAGHETLRQEIETLLAAHDGAPSFLETPAALFGDAISANEKPEPVRERIGRYRVTDTLGEGGMGVVYAAVDEQLERPIALKIIRQDTAGDPVARERFWREARLAARVNHPHICQLYEIGESDGQLFIAMERLEGESLAARLARGAMPLTDTVQIGLEVLAALDALHRRDITHRDLKPSNIFLTQHGAKVLDFGVALPQPSHGSVTRKPLTDPGTILGTPKYMAPEQLLGHLVDGRADLFAAGAILYEMLSGTAAFEIEAIKAEAITELAAAESGGLPVVRVTAASLKKVLGCATGQKWQTRAGERFNPTGRHRNWSQGAAGAVAAALKIAGNP